MIWLEPSVRPRKQDDVAGDLVGRDEPMRLGRPAKREGASEGRFDAAGADLLQAPLEVFRIKCHRSAEVLLSEEEVADVEAYPRTRGEAEGYDYALRLGCIDAFLGERLRLGCR